MKVLFSKKAENGLDKILNHVVKNFSPKQAQTVRDKLASSILKLGKFPEMGSKIAGQSDKRCLVVAGNLVVYEIILRAEPAIVVRNIRPRHTGTRQRSKPTD